MTQNLHPLVRSRLLALPAAALMLCFSGTPLHAVWTGASDLVYNNTANWAGGTIDNVFSGTIGLGTNPVISVGTAGVAQNFSGLTFSYTDAQNLTLLQPGGTASDWNLNGNLSVDIAGTTSKIITLGAPSRLFNLNLGGVTRTFAVDSGSAFNGAGLDTLTVIGNITNGSVLKTGGGTLTINSASDLSGSFDAREGSTFLLKSSDTVNGSMTGVGKVTVSNSMTRFILNSSASDRLNDSAGVVLNGGIFGFQTRSDDPDGITVENVGAITLAGARSAIGVVSVNGKADTILQAASLTRDAYSTLSILSTTSDVIGNGNAFFKVTSDSNILSSLKGAGGAAGSTTLSILPWASAGQPNSNTLTGSYDNSYYVGALGLVTYSNATGFRALTSSEYQTSMSSAAANENVKISANTTLSSDQTINALYVAPASGSILDLGGHKLTLSSGALVTNIQAFTVQNGTLDFGSGIGYFMGGRSNNTISANLQSGAGLVLAPAFRILLTGTINAGTGPLVINNGFLFTQANNRLASSTQLRVDRGAMFQIDGAFTETIASLAGSGTVFFNNSGAKLNVGTSFAVAAANGEVVIGNGGSLSPGDASGDYRADQMTFTGVTSLRFESGSSLYLDLSNATTFDSISVAGAAAINGGTLHVSLLNGFNPTEGQTFTSITGTSAATGTGFTSIIDESGSGYSYTLTAVGNNWVLTASAIPEPSSYALFGGAAALLGGLMIRRRRV